MTNWATINKRIEKFKELEAMEASGEIDDMPKKEATRVRHRLTKLRRNLEGLRNMDRLPTGVFIIDPRKENIALMEARKLDIPVIAVVDTNCDPDLVDFVIPGNDDAIRAANLISKIIANAVLEGLQIRDVLQARRSKEEAEQAAAAAAEAAAEAEKVEEKPEEKPAKKPAKKAEEKAEEKPARKPAKKPEKKAEEKVEETAEEKVEEPVGE